MATPLISIPIVAPGKAGLNLQAAATVLGPEWAVEASNLVFDSSGLLATRKGLLCETSTVVTGNIRTIHEHLTSDGTSTVIFCAGNKIYSNPASPSDITGTATITVGDNWQFVNFDGAVVGFQQGEQPIGRTTGNFADGTTSSGTYPTGNCAVAHSGRIWAADSDKQTIKYCALLDNNHWATGAGSIDMTSVWPKGMDEIVALAMFNGMMVVFGKTQIVLFGDGQGSALGIDPANIYVVDTIVGIGCIARDTVQQTENGDVLFLSIQGVQSLNRLIQEKSNPFRNISANVSDAVTTLAAATTSANIKSAYCSSESIYILSFPTTFTTYVFNTQGFLPDGSYRVTTWNTYCMAAASTVAGTLYTSRAGRVFKYTGNVDGNGDGLTNGITHSYSSGWMDLGQDFAKYTKMVKSLSITMINTGSGIITGSLVWNFDFKPTSFQKSSSAFLQGTQTTETVIVPGSGAGQYIKVGASHTTNTPSGTLALQNIILVTKVGRMGR